MTPQPLRSSPMVGETAVRAAGPRHPNEVARKAKIVTHDGWWYRYAVHRYIGIGIPEDGCSMHRTLKGARRAAARYCRKHTGTQEVEVWHEQSN